MSRVSSPTTFLQPFIGFFWLDVLCKWIENPIICAMTWHLASSWGGSHIRLTYKKSNRSCRVSWTNTLKMWPTLVSNCWLQTWERGWDSFHGYATTVLHYTVRPLHDRPEAHLKIWKHFQSGTPTSKRSSQHRAHQKSNRTLKKGVSQGKIQK